MPRSLLALCLMLLATSAMANSVATGTDPVDSGVKPGKATAVVAAQDGETPTTVQPSVPARSSTPRVTPARWHSMLPGMIR